MGDNRRADLLTCKTTTNGGTTPLDTGRHAHLEVPALRQRAGGTDERPQLRGPSTHQHKPEAYGVSKGNVLSENLTLHIRTFACRHCGTTVVTKDWRRSVSCGNEVCTRAIQHRSARERSRLYKARNLELVKAWQAANPDKVKASGKKTKWRKKLRHFMHLAIEVRWREIEHEKEKE